MPSLLPWSADLLPEELFAFLLRDWPISRSIRKDALLMIVCWLALCPSDLLSGFRSLNVFALLSCRSKVLVGASCFESSYNVGKPLSLC